MGILRVDAHVKWRCYHERASPNDAFNMHLLRVEHSFNSRWLYFKVGFSLQLYRGQKKYLLSVMYRILSSTVYVFTAHTVPYVSTAHTVSNVSTAHTISKC